VLGIVNGAAIFLKSGTAKIASLADWRSAVCVIGISILWRAARDASGAVELDWRRR
jgi:hypothetical protein